MRRILRDMGRDVPPEAQDPDSSEYAAWLESVLEELRTRTTDQAKARALARVLEASKQAKLTIGFSVN